MNLHEPEARHARVDAGLALARRLLSPRRMSLANVSPPIALSLILFSAAASAEEAPPRTVHRLELVVAETAAGKAQTSSSYTLGLEADHWGEIRVSSNVALPGGTTRADLGLALRARYAMAGDALLLESEVEVTSGEDATAIRKLGVRGNALLRPGKPALVARLEDPLTHRTIRVTATATRLR